MTDKQYELLSDIYDALRSQPKDPSYEDYEKGIISREDYYDQHYNYQIVKDIREAIINGNHLD